jgi:hypothetical protein
MADMLPRFRHGVERAIAKETPPPNWRGNCSTQYETANVTRMAVIFEQRRQLCVSDY